MDRRQLLALAASACAGLWLPRGTWAQARLQSNPFALGVASGSPTHDSVVLWTRLVQGDVPFFQSWGLKEAVVRWEVAHDDKFRRIVQSGQTQAMSALAHSVHVEVQGLESDRWYHYRFMLGDAVSETGRTRTFPEASATAQKLRLGYASCQHWEHGFYGAYRHMRDENLDALMFLGDYIYEYGGSTKSVRAVPGGPTVTLDEYRARYALYKSDSDLQRMHAACPWLLTWDDHEVQNDYAGETPGSYGPTVADFAARRAAAYQAYYEHMPLRASVLKSAWASTLGQSSEMRLYGSVPFGRLATLYLLDDRQYRDRQACTKGGATGSSSVNPANCVGWNDPHRTLLGAAQERWLEQALGNRAGQWNVLGQQTVFGQRDFRPGEGQALSNDGWDGYSAARTRLTEALQKQRTSNPVFLGGDVHSNWVGHVKADYARADSQTIGVEFCGTSITSRGGDNKGLSEVLQENPHFIYADRERRGYGVAEFTPKALTVKLRVVDDVTKPDTGIQTLASFAVEAGQPVVHRV